MIIVEITNCNMILEISALSSKKNYKHEYLTVELILPADQRKVIEQAKFTYFTLGRALKYRQKRLTIKERKQADANQSKRLVASTNKDYPKYGHKDIYK